VMATHDDLTQLWNRGAVLEILETELARCAREHSPLVVALLDMDHFKETNDTYGHLAGDAVLRAVARSIRSAIRPYDSAGRYGGEEFLLVLPGMPITEMAGALRRIHQSVCAAPISVGRDAVLRSTCSLGVVCITAEAPSLEQAIARADTALYRAKALGRNRIEYAVPCLAEREVALLSARELCPGIGGFS